MGFLVIFRFDFSKNYPLHPLLAEHIKDMARTNPEDCIEMILNAPIAPWRNISARDAARILGVTTQTLANWRFRGIGPAPRPGMMNSRRQNYTPAEIGAWQAAALGRDMNPDDISRMWLERRGTLTGDVTQTVARLQRAKTVSLVERIAPTSPLGSQQV